MQQCRLELKGFAWTTFTGLASFMHCQDNDKISHTSKQSLEYTKDQHSEVWGTVRCHTINLLTQREDDGDMGSSQTQKMHLWGKRHSSKDRDIFLLPLPTMAFYCFLLDSISHLSSEIPKKGLLSKMREDRVQRGGNFLLPWMPKVIRDKLNLTSRKADESRTLQFAHV